MKIRLEYSKFIKIDKYVNESVIEVPEKCTVHDLVALLGVQEYLKKSVTVHVNGEPSWNSTILKEGDSVMIYRMVSGG
jgi:thiamine biosynthesis protein ThiS